MTFIDFFAGIGGFRLGMEMAGHECLGYCEIDKYADKSYRAMHNIKGSEWFADNIRDVEPGDLPEADCYCGGFPCQAFSVAGKRGGFEDTRGTLFFEVMRLAAVRKPKYLFLENVAGLLSHDGGKTFGTILNTLGQLGYWYEYQVLNSKNFGVPQNRERVFIIGHLGGYSGRKVFPITNSNGQINGNEGQNFYTNTLTTRITADSVGTYVVESQQYAQENRIIQLGNIDQYKRDRNNPSTGRVYSIDGVSPCLSTMQGGGLEPKILCQPVLTPDRADKRQNGRRFKEDGEPMFTLTRQDRHGVMINCINPRKEDGTQTYQHDRVYDINGHLPALGCDVSGRFNVTNGARIRRLTPRECFRLQGFPDEYFDRARQVNSDSQLYKQAGNSVTVNVIYEIAKRLEG
jgi:DNA (cytosine-5)-methyltransferase 1